MLNTPAGLPVPTDDGAADHLPGTALPSLQLESTDGARVDLGKLRGWWVVYIYPMTGRPDVALPDGWNEIPGARGCTPQSCGFRDHHAELKTLSAGVFGLSTQDSAYQREARDRLQLPFELLSDAGLALRDALGIPSFEAAGARLYKRLTIVAYDGRIEKVFYPVFPPAQNAEDVLSWLRDNPQAGPRR
ncbi:peroxiredoxin [Salinisphaera aquimarina]|uniref:Peroxiredoxin n=1 Tax=Salinisphaera aquimarina TaxID=2094031 RepID=A0ABV7EMR3_9GAMM